MTTAVGMEPGAEMDAGGQAGKGQGSVGAGRLGKELSTNWLRPASGDLATGLTSEAPSFRSSWESQVNAWRGVSRGTNGVESQDESEDAREAGTADTIPGAAMSRTANHGQTSVSAQPASSSLASKVARTQQDVSAAVVPGQKETWSDAGRSAGKAVESPGTQMKSTGSTDATATERPGTENRSRAGSATPAANSENTAQAATAGAQAIASAVEAPVELPASPIPSRAFKPTQTAETIPASESNFAFTNLRSTQFSETAQLPGPQLSSAVEIGSTATGWLATGVSGAVAGVRAHTTHTGPAFIPRNTTASQAMHETAEPSLNDADEPDASQQMTSLLAGEARSAESQREPSIAPTAVTPESPSGQSVPTSSTGDLNRAATAGSVVPSETPVATLSGPVQASADTVEEPSKQFTDRIMPRAANRDAAGESVPSATQVSAAQPAGVDAVASSGQRIPGAPHIFTASAPQDQPAAASAAATARDTFSALDAGTSPGTPAWTHAGSQHAEAGFRDPALGWVGVRADLNAGGIHATLVPSSAEAAQALNGHLAGLSTHLVEQQSPVASLSMASPGDNGIENGMGQRMQQGAEGNPQGNAPEESQAGSQESAPPAPSTFVQAASGQAGNLDPLARTGELRGTHISVMA